MVIVKSVSQILSVSIKGDKSEKVLDYNLPYILLKGHVISMRCSQSGGFYCERQASGPSFIYLKSDFCFNSDYEFIPFDARSVSELESLRFCEPYFSNPDLRNI